jgi:hypothetical protein
MISPILTNMKMLKITEETHTELTKVKGQLTANTGKVATYDDAILYLIQTAKKSGASRT